MLGIYIRVSPNSVSPKSRLLSSSVSDSGWLSGFGYISGSAPGRGSMHSKFSFARQLVVFEGGEGRGYAFKYVLNYCPAGGAAECAEDMLQFQLPLPLLVPIKLNCLIFCNCKQREPREIWGFLKEHQTLQNFHHCVTWNYLFARSCRSVGIFCCHFSCLATFISVV